MGYFFQKTMCKNVSVKDMANVVANCCSWGTTFYKEGEPLSFSPFWEAVCGELDTGSSSSTNLLSTLIPGGCCLANWRIFRNLVLQEEAGSISM